MLPVIKKNLNKKKFKFNFNKKFTKFTNKNKTEQLIKDLDFDSVFKDVKKIQDIYKNPKKFNYSENLVGINEKELLDSSNVILE